MKLVAKYTSLASRHRARLCGPKTQEVKKIKKGVQFGTSYFVPLRCSRLGYDTVQTSLI